MKARFEVRSGACDWLRVLMVLVAAFASGAAAWAGANDAQAHATPTSQAGEGSTNALAKGSSYAVPRHVIAGGGGIASGGSFALQGTLGLADADPLQPSSGGAFAISGGYWAGHVAPPAPTDSVFANGFE